MGDEVTKTVTSTSDGSVKLTVEKYHELLAKAAEKAPVTVLQKTHAQIAQENKAWGAVMIGGGVCLAVIGTCVHLLGRAQERASKKDQA